MTLFVRMFCMVLMTVGLMGASCEKKLDPKTPKKPVVQEDDSYDE